MDNDLTKVDKTTLVAMLDACIEKLIDNDIDALKLLYDNGFSEDDCIGIGFEPDTTKKAFKRYEAIENGDEVDDDDDDGWF